MNNSSSVVFLDLASLDKDDLDTSALRQRSAEFKAYPSTAPEQVQERIAGRTVVITNKVVIDDAAMQSNPALRLILVAATGTNNIDLVAAERLGIQVRNCQAYGTPAVAQHTLMLMLVLITRFESYRQAVKDGAWQRSSQFCLLDYPIAELAGKTLGILGYGELGQAVGRLAEAFGMHVIAGALPGRPHADRPELAALLPQVDVLSLHCPLTEHTRNMLDAQALALMKPGSLLINAARGGLVDEQALVDSLRSGHLGGAACDVLSVEPPVDGNPLLANDIPNLVITPHSAWGSREARQRIVGQLADGLSTVAE
ncbi:2-hydroxyacid dehydrogenase [Halopseudomonas pelagia]|uniref:2-hydroxyacid dehydrogenase n=1 Tax=Halopseudomonas pelagia TaxID=553151 RepID=UPI0003A10F5C|nr:2-hydroxyacid dehydrogenase [Halopseudomonas pelagia]|tara:strand:+ start:21699 stop:22637 length:939 start_codon:yes stop_codon:yes gene_type:complete